MPHRMPSCSDCLDSARSTGTNEYESLLQAASVAAIFAHFPLSQRELIQLRFDHARSPASMEHPPTIQTSHVPHVPRIPVRSIVGSLAFFVLIVLAWTSYYTVQAESEGVVLRFGRFLKPVEPGLHF